MIGHKDIQMSNMIASASICKYNDKKGSGKYGKYISGLRQN